MVRVNGEYGCLGDLGMHVLHMPLRFGWLPPNVRGLLSKIVTERPDGKGGMAPCETWDNAILACEVQTARPALPDAAQHQAHRARRDQHLVHQGARHRVLGRVQHQVSQDAAHDDLSVRRTAGWETLDLGYASAYPAITGGIFEFGFSDAILQMWAAFCDELVHGAAGMRQPFCCATPEETHAHHRVLTAALESGRTGQTVPL